ncbi:MAG: hypothetical protein ABJ314_12760, partial [Ilumatobacter sp.]
MSNDHDVATVVFSRSIRGGIAGLTRSSCELRGDGECTIVETDAAATTRLTLDQVELATAICHASGLTDLPSQIEGPRTRSDGYTSTYAVGDHRSSMFDVARAGDAVPSAFHVIDALVDALSTL